jgi:hypothetical protein
MTPQLAAILDDLGIAVIPFERYRHPGETHAAETMQRILDRRGAGHLTFVLRSIVETINNKRELVAPMLWAISDMAIAHPEWTQTTQWLDAIDSIDLEEIRHIAKANRNAAPLRPAIATMIYLHLREVFDPKDQRKLI